MDEVENNIPDYITFGRTFENYRWYKPLATMVLAAIFYIIFSLILAGISDLVFGPALSNSFTSGGYDNLSSSNLLSYMTFLVIGLAFPAIYLANRIVKDRPFSSYGSSLGGWRWKLYLKCLALPAVLYLIMAIASLLNGSKQGSGINQLTPVAFIIFLILVPLQSIAEEYAFRGVLMQALGSWLKMPVAAIIIQSIIFGVIHSYNPLGMVAIIITGILYGFLSWKSHGLEASSAMHTVNNLSVAYMGSLGLSSVASAVSIYTFLYDLVIQVACFALIFYVGKRYGWFESKN